LDPIVQNLSNLNSVGSVYVVIRKSRLPHDSWGDLNGGQLELVSLINGGCHTPQFASPHDLLLISSFLFPTSFPLEDMASLEIMAGSLATSASSAGVKKLACRVCQKGFTKAEHLRVSRS
jgi:hypothetical protein